MPAASKVSNSLYDEDFLEWTQQQANLLRERRFADLDLENLIDEVASVGRSQRREVYSRLEVILAHLLKWKFQPGARSSGWRGTLREQRARLAMVLDESPSLKGYPDEIFRDAYLSGRLLAAKETGIDFTLFPEQSPFTPAQALDDDFLPREPDLLDQPDGR
jgi:hypothetical protein